jgi:hypothetical protein
MEYLAVAATPAYKEALALDLLKKTEKQEEFIKTYTSYECLDHFLEDAYKQEGDTLTQKIIRLLEEEDVFYQSGDGLFERHTSIYDGETNDFYKVLKDGSCFHKELKIDGADFIPISESGNLFKPSYNSMEELLEEIRKNLRYIPDDFDIFETLIYIVPTYGEE